MKLSFDEINNWAEFEDLAASYFRLQNEYNVEVKFSADNCTEDRRNLILTFKYNSPILRSFKQKWVVQSKFYDRDIRNSDFADINIPSLIHEYNAVGFLLICRRGVVHTLQQKFINLETNCKFDYTYQIWTGADFAGKIFEMESDIVIKQYFPNYFEKRRKQ